MMASNPPNNPFQSWLEACMSTTTSQDGPDSATVGQLTAASKSASSSNHISSSSSSSSSSITDGISLRLRHEARLHFEALSFSSSPETVAATNNTDSNDEPSSVLARSSNPSISSHHQKIISTIEQDVSTASSSTPNGALALLVSCLKSAMSPSSSRTTTTARARAFHCLLGAMEGSNSLTHGVRQAVGRMLLHTCRGVVGGSDNNNEIDYNGNNNNNNEDDDITEDETNKTQQQQQQQQQQQYYVDSINLTPEEVTQQLQSMDYAQRTASTKGIANSETSLMSGEDVRDAAMMCLTALLRTGLTVFPTQQSQQLLARKLLGAEGNDNMEVASSPLSPLMEAMNVVHQSMELRLELAMMGIRYRCHGSNGSDNSVGGSAGDGYYESMDVDDANASIEEELSQLPRAKRSICFTLLGAALEGLAMDAVQWNELQSRSRALSSSTTSLARSMECILPSSLFKRMTSFASLSASCLHGETDPRCLLQLLRLLNQTQQVMLPLFEMPLDNDGDANGMDAGNTDTNAQFKIAPSSSSSSSSFPSIEFFDAVAPYYPVHFTPPKNDPHGITRDMLHEALMGVLCERGAVYDNRSLSIKSETEEEEEEENETMTVLAARMFLERLDPPKSSMEDYDPPSNGVDSEMEDKLDALCDLSSLFLSPLSSKDGTVVDTATSSKQELPLNITTCVTPSFLLELSSSLARVHEEAVSSAAKNNTGASSPTNDQKSLASAIRQFASALALALEPTTTSSVVSTMAVSKKSNISSSSRKTINTTRLWESFVLCIINHLSPILGSAPQGMHGRATTAYLASLAAGGGLLTLTKVLEGCVPRFLGVLSLLDKDGIDRESNASNQVGIGKNRDEEKMSAAMRGIAALMSSCRVALDRWQRENCGAQVYPHPLSPYISPVVQKLALILNGSSEEDDMGSLSLAAVCAVESILTSANLLELGEEDMALLERSFSALTCVVMNKKGEYGNTDTNSLEWKTACARTLGAVIANGLSREEGGNGEQRKQCEKLSVYAESLLPKMIASATTPYRDESKSCAHRYDWIVLAGACANGTPQVSREITSELCSSIIKTLRSTPYNEDAMYCIPAMALSYMVRHGGPNVCTAFHSLSSPETSPSTIINELCQLSQQRSREDSTENGGKVLNRHIPVGMSQLQLPDSKAKDEEEATVAIWRSYSVLPYLIPAYENPISSSSCYSLVHFIDQVLPPLCELDQVKLCVSLPLLAAVLTSSNQVWTRLDSATKEGLKSMCPYIVQFCISTDHDAISRSAASSCLFSILFHNTSDEDRDGDDDEYAGTIQTLLTQELFPALDDSMVLWRKDLSDEQTSRASGGPPDISGVAQLSNLSRVQDILNFISVLGSAAACKGGPYSRAADKIGTFLVEIACTGSALFPFTDKTLLLVPPTQTGRKHPIMDPPSHASILPSSAFGNMLSVNNGGPFWRQRIAHKTLPIILKALQDQAQSQNPPALGTLAIVCHMLCCLPAALLGESIVRQFVPTLVAGLVYFSKNVSELDQSEKISPRASAVLLIVLAGLVKLLVNSPGDLTKFIGIIIPSLSLLCTATESESHIPSQIIVLQCLELVTKHSARNAVLREKDQVVVVLSALVDHPSAIVRQAVVQVRNVWYTLA